MCNLNVSILTECIELINQDRKKECVCNKWKTLGIELRTYGIQMIATVTQTNTSKLLWKKIKIK